MSINQWLFESGLITPKNSGVVKKMREMNISDQVIYKLLKSGRVKKEGDNVIIKLN